MHALPRQAAPLVFGLLCVLGALTILTALGVELARAHRGEGVPMRQLRWRILGGVLWIVIFGAFAYATLQLWPSPGDKQTAKQFISVLSGAVLLLPIALILLLIDWIQVGRARRREEARFQRQLEDLVEQTRREMGN